MKNFIVFVVLETTYKEIPIFSFPLKIFLAANVTRKRLFHFQFRQSYCADGEFIFFFFVVWFFSSCNDCHIHMLQFLIFLIFKFDKKCSTKKQAQKRLQNEVFKFITQAFSLRQSAKKTRKTKKRTMRKNASFQLFSWKFYHFFQKS